MRDVRTINVGKTTVDASNSNGGLLTYRLISAATTNATSVKTSPGRVYVIRAQNITGSADVFLKVYDKASAPTVGTDTPISTYFIRADEVPPIDLGIGQNFTNGIAFALTRGLGDSDTTAISANECVVNLFYA